MKLKVCNNFKDRLIGICFKRKKIDKCYYFPNCKGIHTFFCFQNIDVIMTDKNNNILYEYKNLKPWRIILPKKGVVNTYEFPPNTTRNEIKYIVNLKKI